MGRPCAICTSPVVHKVNRLLLAGELAVDIADMFQLSAPAIRRHRRNHLTTKLQRDTQASLAKSRKKDTPDPTLVTDLTTCGPDFTQALDIVQIVHQQFSDLEAAKRALKTNEDARGVAVVADLILKHADKIAPSRGHDVSTDPGDLVRPLTDKLLQLAEKHPAIKDDLTDLLLEIERAG